MLNRVVLIGRLTSDPNLKYIPSGKAVANFTLAVDRGFTNKQGEREADFFPIVAWGKVGENTCNYTAKGSLVAVDGRLQTRNYEKDGRRVYITEVVAENVRFLDKKGQAPHEQYGVAADPDAEDSIPF